ncbi:DUF2069 domain-containing protein [Cupriavidus sp. AU9028]|uniref:DUF2069 domain-containing protein n=1 Tax=Cupriavidus sp. AU9028 TaxID=2871157 RepID=UPI001C943E76|nr:DUF2069 domain-containing protein [Cupriavidus sp. AU9028]MBY4898779.1 DUF2069 domain-containing protein [Cupriavidus sp. AU9028]
MRVPDVPDAELARRSDADLHNSLLYRTGLASWLALIALAVAWEWFLAPLRPGGSWLLLKALPLLLPLRGLFARDRYTMQWSTMLILLYFTEGVVRGASDRAPSSLLAWVEVALTLCYFFAIIFYLRPYKRRARARSKPSSGPA